LRIDGQDGQERYIFGDLKSQEGPVLFFGQLDDDLERTLARLISENIITDYYNLLPWCARAKPK
jgi:hypothetical protein